jgi:hypothetical protein
MIAEPQPSTANSRERLVVQVLTIDSKEGCAGADLEIVLAGKEGTQILWNQRLVWLQTEAAYL